MGIGIWELLIVLAIVLILFGAKKLRNIGSDLGGAIRSFKQSMKEEEEKPGSTEDAGPNKHLSGDAERVIDGEVVSKEKHKA